MRKWYRVENLLSNTIKIKYNNGTSEIDLMTNANVKTYIENVFCGYMYRTKYDITKTKAENIASATEAFTELWNMHFGVKQNDINRFFLALYKEYDPTVNYKIETRGTITDAMHNGHKESVDYNVTDTESGGNTREIEGGSTDTLTPTIKTKETRYVAGADSTVGALEGYNESEVTEGTNENVNEHSQTITDDTTHATAKTGNKTTTIEDISETVFDKSVKSFENYVREGNAGNVSVQRLLNEELQLRLKNYIYRLLEEFICSFCIFFEPFNECEVIE